MFKLKKYISILSIVLIGLSALGCSPIINRNSVTLNKNRVYAIGAFWNYTQTPMAGLKASSIVESILSKRGVKIISLINGIDEIESSQSQDKLIQLQEKKAIEQNADYLVIGSVQEWRYKTGIDAEPAVSYSIKIIDLKSNRIIFNGVGADSGLSYQSIGEIAQKVAEKLIPQFI